jgi:hypothetical protein
MLYSHAPPRRSTSSLGFFETPEQSTHSTQVVVHRDRVSCSPLRSRRYTPGQAKATTRGKQPARAHPRLQDRALHGPFARHHARP